MAEVVTIDRERQRIYWDMAARYTVPAVHKDIACRVVEETQEGRTMPGVLREEEKT